MRNNFFQIGCLWNMKIEDGFEDPKRNFQSDQKFSERVRSDFSCPHSTQGNPIKIILNRFLIFK